VQLLARAILGSLSLLTFTLCQESVVGSNSLILDPAIHRRVGLCCRQRIVVQPESVSRSQLSTGLDARGNKRCIRSRTPTGLINGETTLPMTLTYCSLEELHGERDTPEESEQDTDADSATVE